MEDHGRRCSRRSGLIVGDPTPLWDLEQENATPKRLLADFELDEKALGFTEHGHF